MTIKPARTQVEREKQEEKIRYLRREQQEIEAKRAMRDFIRHNREEDYETPNRDVHWDES